MCQVIVPPSWIVKLPRKGSFKSSLKYSPNKTKSNKDDDEGDEGGDDENKKKKKKKKKEAPFCIKHIPNADVAPLLVFLNPKSGGNQGVKLMQKFQWVLNPRQVFDLTKGGPGPAIEMFK